MCDEEDGQRDDWRSESKIQASKTTQLLKTVSVYPKYPSARDWKPVFESVPHAGPEELYKTYSIKINLES